MERDAFDLILGKQGAPPFVQINELSWVIAYNQYSRAGRRDFFTSKYFVEICKICTYFDTMYVGTSNHL